MAPEFNASCSFVVADYAALKRGGLRLELWDDVLVGQPTLLGAAALADLLPPPAGLRAAQLSWAREPKPAPLLSPAGRAVRTPLAREHPLVRTSSHQVFLNPFYRIPYLNKY